MQWWMQGLRETTVGIYLMTDSLHLEAGRKKLHPEYYKPGLFKSVVQISLGLFFVKCHIHTLPFLNYQKNIYRFDF